MQTTMDYYQNKTRTTIKTAKPRIYVVEGLRFAGREGFVRGVADINRETYINTVSDGDLDKMPEVEEFVEDTYRQIMSGQADGVWSEIDNEGSSGSIDVPDEIRFLGEQKIKAIIRDYYTEMEA